MKKLISDTDIKNWFTYHPPTTSQIVRYGLIREEFEKLATSLNEKVPDCADKVAAFRDLRNCVMRFNLAIACNEIDANDLSTGNIPERSDNGELTYSNLGNR